jgi:hypothetical protein
MRVLFLHPEDSPFRGPWTRERWDLVVDLGFASAHTYEEWARSLRARVLSLRQFAGQTESYRWVNQVLQYGRGRLLDRHGLDWWEILGTQRFQDLQALYLVNQLCLEMDRDDVQFSASRSHRLIRIIEQVFRLPVQCFQDPDGSSLRRMRRMLRSAQNLRRSQIVEIAFDKWDAGYRIRRYATRHRRAKLVDNAVVLPSAYSNVTRTVLAYAKQLPHRSFLLVTTRRNALPGRLPENVVTAPLAAYASPATSIRAELAELTEASRDLLRAMPADAEQFQQTVRAGLWDCFPGQLEIGLLLREAWMRLLAAEPIIGVLCGDDLNYHTRLPLLLARGRGLNSVYCSHGALDGGFLFKASLADSYLVKGRMEGDYLQQVSNVGADRVWVAAPGKNTDAAPGDHSQGMLTFFSQPYEVEGGRADVIYQELLPRLYSTAQQVGRRLVIKLHPFESLRARKALVKEILPGTARRYVDVLSDVSPEQVISRAWCGVTVDSSVTVECTLKKVPCFLCGWLDFGGMGYLRQFARFGAGIVLDAPADIECIPDKVAEYQADRATAESLWQEADPMRLDEIIFRASPVPQAQPCAS